MYIFTPNASEAVGSDTTFDLRLGWMLGPIWQRPVTYNLTPLAVAFLVGCLQLHTKYHLYCQQYCSQLSRANTFYVQHNFSVNVAYNIQ